MHFFDLRKSQRATPGPDPKSTPKTKNRNHKSYFQIFNRLENPFPAKITIKIRRIETMEIITNIIMAIAVISCPIIWVILEIPRLLRKPKPRRLNRDDILIILLGACILIIYALSIIAVING